MEIVAKRKSKEADLQALKTPPHSIEAEQAVLGGLMLDHDAWDKVSDKITEPDFYRKEHQLIYAVMAELTRKDIPFDVLTISDALKNREQLEVVGGEVYLFELSRNTPSAANIEAYAGIVRQRSVLRQLIHIGTDIAESGFKPEGREVQELLDGAEQRIFAIAEQGARASGPESIGDLLALSIDRIHQLNEQGGFLTGLTTGFKDLDHKTLGLQPADLIIVAGRPSMGKTVLGMNIAEAAAISSGKPVLVFSMEMPGIAIATRMLSSLGRIDQQRIRTGDLKTDDWERVSSSLNVLAEAKLFVDDTPGLSPTELRARARRLAKSHGQLGLIVIDYLQLMQVPGNRENRTAEISEISRSLKTLAKELNVPVVALSQLNRSLEQRQDKRPVMSDLRESGAIEQDADLIMFIYRDEVYNPETAEKGKAEIIIGKQRNGPIGTTYLSFHGQFTRFDDYISEHAYSGGSFA